MILPHGRPQNTGKNVEERKIYNFRYADDTSLLTNDEQQMFKFLRTTY